MMNNRHILFIHIPKTAGTSFRIAVEEAFDTENIVYDYSPQVHETSACVLEMIYEDVDHYKLHEHISNLSHSFFSGHFSTNKYAPIYDTLDVVSFVRNPVEQVISHYNHYKNLHGYEKDLHAFIHESKFKNIQSKFLRGKPIELYGFLGLTEEYTLSLEMFNTLYNTDLKWKHINVKKENSINREDLDEEMIDRIVQLNEKDVVLYETVKKQFEVRKALYEEGLPFTYGFVQKRTNDQLSGIAFQHQSDKAVEIDIYAGDVYIDTVLSKNLRPGQLKQNVPRRGYIGFDYTLPAKKKCKESLRAVVKETGQELL